MDEIVLDCRRIRFQERRDDFQYVGVYSNLKLKLKGG